MSSRTWLWILGGMGLLIFLTGKYTKTGQSIVNTISNAGLNMIAQFEGFSATAYNDPPGSDKWSIGFGHQIQPGEDNLMTATLTVDQARQMLSNDTAHAQAVVRDTITYPLSPAQFDALVSFVYNVGAGAFKSGSVPFKINAGNLPDAAATMRQYDMIHAPDGTLIVSAVLKGRRSTEASAFA